MKSITKLAVAAIVAVMASLGANAQQLMLTKQQAVQLVKAQRTDSANLAADFYAANISEFVFDGLTPVDSVNVPTWVLGNSQKILVFVDESPQAKWIHPCSFYYVTGNRINSQIYRMDGLMPPHAINLKPIDVHLGQSDYAQVPSDPGNPHVLGQDVFETGTHVMLLVDMLNGSTYGKSNTQSWNECASLYNLLVNFYKVPKQNVHVFMGAVEYGEDEYGYWIPTDTIMYDDHGNAVPLMRDLDDDGVDDVQFASDLGAFEDFCANMSDSLDVGDIEHLFFCYIGNTHIYPFDNGDEAQTNTGIFAGELNMAFWLKAQNQTFMFDCPYASKFMRHISHRENVVLMGTQNEYDPDFMVSDHGEDLFFKYWINGLAGFNVKYPAIAVNSDENKDGYVTLYEAFKYAKDNHPGSDARYESIPPKLIKELSFDINSRTNLKVHQGENYNSPDIWIRNESDGFTNQTQGRIYVSNNNRTKYIYVRIHNDGRKTYRENDRYLYLYWQKPYMGRTFSLPEGYTPDGGFIDYLTITDSITSNSSTILEYQWYVPDNLLTYAQANGGLLPISLIAQVYNDDCGNILAPQDYAKSTKVVFNPENGLYVVENIDGMQMYRYFKSNVPISFTQNISGVSVGYQGGNYNMFSHLKMGFRFSENNPVSQMTFDDDYFAVDTYDSQRLRILSSGGLVSGIPTTTSSSVDLYCHCNGILQIAHPYYHEDFNLEFYDNQMNLVDGMELVCEIDSLDLINPEPNPGIGVHGNPGGVLTLTAQNVIPNDELSWYGNDMENLGHNGQITVQPEEASGIVTLQVNRDGDNSYASVLLNCLVRISDVVFTQDGMMRVSLTSPCGSDYSILATSTLQASTTINIQIDNGSTQVLLPVPAGASGPFVVSLMNGDTLVDSRQIIQ